jgi:hypothetical protein
VAEWLRNGLQNRVPRFNSGRGLQASRHLALPPGAPAATLGMIRTAAAPISSPPPKHEECMNAAMQHTIAAMQ